MPVDDLLVNPTDAGSPPPAPPNMLKTSLAGGFLLQYRIAMALHPQDAQRLEAYITQYQQHGYSLEQIQQGLIAAGWPEQDSAEAIARHKRLGASKLAKLKSYKGPVGKISEQFDNVWLSRVGHRAILASTTGIVVMLITLFALPSEADQQLMQLQVDVAGKYVSQVLPSMLIVAAATSFLLGVTFHYKLQERYGLEWIFYAAVSGTLLAVIINHSTTLGVVYVLLLPLTITAAGVGLQQLAIRKNIVHRLGFIISIVILILLAIITLNSR